MIKFQCPDMTRFHLCHLGGQFEALNHEIGLRQVKLIKSVLYIAIYFVALKAYIVLVNLSLM